MTSQSEILPFIRTELRALPRTLRIAETELDSHLVDDLGLDSLERVTIALALEEKFGVEISDMTIAKWRVVSDIAASVAAHT